MKYFLVEGKFNNPIPVGGVKLDSLVKEHLKRLNNEVKEGRILFTSSKKDNSGVIFFMKAEERHDVDKFIAEDPLYIKEVQFYTVIELSIKDVDEKIADWM